MYAYTVLNKLVRNNSNEYKYKTFIIGGFFIPLVIILEL